MKRFVIGILSLAVLIAGGLYIKQVIHDTIETRQPGQRYLVSLGDSVASGAGLDPQRNPRNPGCDLATTAFPYLLGKQLQLPVQQFACSGAEVGVLSSAGPTSLTNQLANATQYISDSEVVVTVGANDVGWLQFLLTCTRENCATDQNKQNIKLKVANLQSNLTELLASILADRPRHVIVNTYYNLLKPGDVCAAQLGITEDEVRFMNDQETVLNSAIARAASERDLKPVVLDFTGHLLCDKDSWLQGIQDPAPLHPTTAGQAYIAQQDAIALQ